MEAWQPRALTQEKALRATLRIALSRYVGCLRGPCHTASLARGLVLCASEVLFVLKTGLRLRRSGRDPLCAFGRAVPFAM